MIFLKHYYTDNNVNMIRIVYIQRMIKEINFLLLVKGAKMID